MAALRLITFSDGAGTRPAILTDDGVVEIAGAPGGDTGLLQIIEGWDRWETGVRTSAADRSAKRIDPKAGKILAPLRYPGKILMAGANYSDHHAEMRARPGEQAEKTPAAEPYLFLIPGRHCVIGSGDPVIVPPFATNLDWEVEVVIVIGKTAKNVPPERAMDYVFGFTIGNDVTSRQANRRTDGNFRQDWFSGKGLDSFFPMGPAVVPKEDVQLPLRLKLAVNGEVMQNSDTSKLTFDMPALIAYASARATLDPGDVISTGTPSGVGAGRGVFLKNGDVMTASVEGIGELVNEVRAQ